jgi:hypothetical protein
MSRTLRELQRRVPIRLPRQYEGRLIGAHIRLAEALAIAARFSQSHGEPYHVLHLVGRLWVVRGKWLAVSGLWFVTRADGSLLATNHKPLTTVPEEES